MRKRFIRFAAVASTAAVLATLLSTAGAAAASAPVAIPATNQVGCASRTDFWQMWTEYHGYPVCYANAGFTYYGSDPPNNTWTTSDVCSGNNSGSVNYFVWIDGEWSFTWYDLGYGQCVHLRQMWGESVEVASIVIN